MTAEEIHEEASALLARHEHRYTASRRSLVDILGARGPMTLPQILANDDELSQSSAYRNLDVLEQSGVIRRIAAGGDHAAFELAEVLIGHHHHLICLSCESIEDIHIGEPTELAIDAALSEAAQAAGFTPVHHTLDLHGLCKNCNNVRTVNFGE